MKSDSGYNGNLYNTIELNKELFEEQKNESHINQVDNDENNVDDAIDTEWSERIGRWIGKGVAIALFISVLLFMSKPNKADHMQEWETALDKIVADSGIGWQIIHGFNNLTGGTDIANELFIHYEEGWFTSSLYYNGELVSFGILGTCWSYADKDFLDKF